MSAGKVTLYMGRPLTELSKEELIEAVEVAGLVTERLRKDMETMKETYELILSCRPRR